MPLRTIAETYGILASAVVAGKLFGLVASAVLARSLDPAGLGTFGAALTLLGYAQVLTNFGLDAVGTKEVSLDPSRAASVVAAVRRFRMRMAVMGAGAAAAVGFALRGAAYLAIPLGLSTLSLALRDDWLLVALGRARAVAMGIVVREVLFLVLLALLVVPTHSLFAAGCCFCVAELGWSAFLRRQAADLTNRAAEPEGRQFHRFVQDGWPLVLMGLMSLTYSKLDVPLLVAMRGAVEAGNYFAAYGVIFGVLGIAAPLSRAAFPELARARPAEHGGRVPLVVRLGVVAAVAGTGAAIVLSLAADELMRAIYGGAYAAGSSSLRILAWSVPITYSSAILLQHLIASGRQRAVAMAATLTAITNVGCNLAMVPRLGAAGAAIATMASESVLLASVLWISRLTPGVPGLARALAAVGAAAFAALVLSRLVAGTSELARLLVAVGALCLLSGPVVVKALREGVLQPGGAD